MIRSAFARAIAAANASAHHGGEDHAIDIAAVWAAFDAAVQAGEFWLDCDDVPALIREYEAIEGDGSYDLDDICGEAEARVALAIWLDCDVPA